MKDLNVKTNWTPADVALFKDALDKMIQLTPFRLNLDDDERRANPTVADARLPYCKDCNDYGVDHQAALNMTNDEVAELQQTYQDFLWVSHLLGDVDTFRAGLADAKHMLGANLFKLSRDLHLSVKLAAQKGKPGMRAVLQTLDERYAQQGNFKKKKDENSSSGGPNPTPIPGPGPQEDVA
jgi:hypothetical protein